MNHPGAHRSTSPALSSEQFARLFPFYLLIDHQLAVIDAGPSFLPICPDLPPGASLRDHFILKRPGQELSFTNLSAAEGFSGEILNYHRSGAEYWVAVEVQPIRD
jgi:Heme NO binding associated